MQLAERLPPPDRSRQSYSAVLWWGEVLLIALCFAAFAGQTTPDVNESHYLTKAKHFWNPDWCPDDIFLSSSFSHLVFYVTTGWLTLFCSLTTYAWIGRFLTWLLLAAAYKSVAANFFAVRFLSIVAAMFFVILNERFDMAGEWIVGGFEAKGPAWAFALFALSSLLKGNWRSAWVLLGCSSAFHVLVGGWATLCALATFAIVSGWPAPLYRFRSAAMIRRFRQQAPALLIGFAIALLGIVPPLLDWSDPQATIAANDIYVFERISHHLNFASFPAFMIGRFLTIVLLWRVLEIWYRKRFAAAPTTRLNMEILSLFTAGTLAIAFVGILMSGLAEQGGGSRVFANSILKFYLFRMSDVVVPLSLSLIGGAFVSRWIADRSDFQHRICGAVFVGCIVMAFAAMSIERHGIGIPRGDRRLVSHVADDPKRSLETWRNWKRMCVWINENTPTDAAFITPPKQQSFKWHAGRTEVCNWKDIPQDPDSMRQWRQRIAQLVHPVNDSDLGIFVYSDEQICALARNYNADYLVARQGDARRLNPPTTLKQVYPASPDQKTTWVVYDLSAASE